MSNHGYKEITQSDDIEELTEVDNLTKILYSDIQENVSLEYELCSDYVKENIIIEDICEDYNYSFELNVEGLDVYINEDGSISLYDEEDGTEKYYMPAPFMYDNTGELSYDVEYELAENEEGTYEIIVEANEEWINAEERAFPVVVDPTIRTTRSVYDTYINGSYPDKNYGSSDELWISKYRTTFIRIPLSELPEEAIVQSAELGVAFYYHSSVTSGYVTAKAYRVTSSWSEYGHTWNTAAQKTNYGYSATTLDSVQLKGSVGAYEDTPGWVSFDITDAVEAWANGSGNYGIALKYFTGTNSSVIVKSYESEAWNRPYITITYTLDDEQVIEDGVYWLSSKAAKGSNGNARVMDVTGNSAAANTEIQQWASPNPSTEKYRAQLYKIKYVGNGYYRIYTFSNPNYCLNAGLTSITTASETSNMATTKWKIEGNETEGYTITSARGSSYAISVPASTTNGAALVYTSKTASNSGRNRWNLNRFDGYVFSVVSDPGVFGNSTGTGHSFFVFENTSQKSANVGYVSVMPGQTITIGTAGEFFEGISYIAAGIAISGHGVAPSVAIQLADEKNLVGEDNEGIFYNREAYNFYKKNYYVIRDSLTILIDADDLNTINNDFLKNEPYNDWNLLALGSHNCSWFAMEMWNAVSDYKVDAYETIIGLHTPVTLCDSIKKYAWSTTQIEMPESEWYGYYDSNGNYFTYVKGDGGGYPTVMFE